MSSFKAIKQLLSDSTDRVTGSIFHDDGAFFRISTRHGTLRVARSDRYRVGDRVYLVKGAIAGKLNETQTKVYEV